jgi:PAS domain S-box-containing protein
MRPRTVLLVEDNPGDARLIQEMLREADAGGWRVEIADRFSAARSRLSAGGIDLVLLDLSLPDAQGFSTFVQAHAAIQAHAAAPHVPIVVLTGLSDEQLAIRAVQGGAQDYLVKGEVTPQMLKRAMHYAIERARGEAERTELLRREQAAHDAAEAERARLQAILESAAHAIIFVDRETRYVTANAAASRQLGLEIRPEGGVQQYLDRLHSPEGEPLAPEQLLATRAMGGEAVTDVELRVRRPDGTEIPVLGSAAPVRGPGDRITGAVVIFQDISRLKELEKQREEWTSVVAHDLRQPVAAINVYAAALMTLAERGAPPEQTLPRVAHIAAAAEQIERMIGDLLDVSRLGAGRLKLQMTSVDLTLLVQQIVQRLDAVADRNLIQVQVQAPIPRVSADAARLEQVLGNLLSNAAKYGSAGTPIQIAITAAAGEVAVAVSNEGKGIPAEELERVFSRYYRAESARSSAVPGLGLGLYVSRELIRAHGGRMWAESTPGQRTTFSFTLPAANA